jgi:hypothetical protein
MFTADGFESMDLDIHQFMRWSKKRDPSGLLYQPPQFTNKWFSSTAFRIFAANHAWKNKDRRFAMAMVAAADMAPDWAYAAREWMQRRMMKAAARERG